MSEDLNFKISKFQEEAEMLRKLGPRPDDIGKVLADIIDAVVGLNEEQKLIKKRIDRVGSMFKPIG